MTGICWYNLKNYANDNNKQVCQNNLSKCKEKHSNNMKTFKMKKVLIALDYDPTAQKVAETGFSLAKTMGAEVILLHVISDVHLG